MRQTRILVHNSTLVVLILAQKQDQQLQVGSNEEKRRPTVNHSKQASLGLSITPTIFRDTKQKKNFIKNI